MPVLDCPPSSGDIDVRPGRCGRGGRSDRADIVSGGEKECLDRVVVHAVADDRVVAGVCPDTVGIADQVVAIDPIADPEDEDSALVLGGEVGVVAGVVVPRVTVVSDTDPVEVIVVGLAPLLLLLVV